MIEPRSLHVPRGAPRRNPPPVARRQIANLFPAGGLARVRAGMPVGLLALTAGSLLLREGGLPNRLWMDEGIAVGIASHPLAQIPGLLRLDGSPPLYYALLHAWMAVTGRSEVALHWLSLVSALLCVPAAWWMGASAFGRRTGWTCAVLVACSPFLSTYAVDARMYSLLVLVGLLCTGCFVAAYAQRRRAYRVPFGLLLAALLYIHNWALFLGIGLAAALAAVLAAAPARERAALLRDGLVGLGIAGLLYLPWAPTALFQARHTGAPWGRAPSLAELIDAPARLLGGRSAALVVVIAAGAGLTGLIRSSPPGRRAAVPALLALAVVPVALGWLVSQASPAWDSRYLAIVLAPVLLLAARGLAQAGAGVVALAAVVALSLAAGVHAPATNASQIAGDARPLVHRGDLVVSTQPEQIPLLAYYLPGGLRYASPFGLVRDTRVMDWRDAVEHLARTSVAGQLLPLLNAAPVGSDVLLVQPAAWDANSRRTAWGRREHRRSDEYERTLLHDRRFALLAALPDRPGARHAPLAGLLFHKTSA